MNGEGTTRPGQEPLEGPVLPSSTDARVKREVDLLATIMDDLIRVPGTDFGVGLDGIIGLVPGVGDSVTTVVASV